MKTTVEYISPGELVDQDGVGCDLGTVYSQSFVEDVNGASDRVIWSSDYINEIFMHFYLRVVEITLTLKGSGADSISFKQYKGAWSIHAVAAKNASLHIDTLSWFYFCFLSLALSIFSFFLVVVSSLIIPGLTLLTRRGPAAKVSPVFSIMRSPASYDKMRFLNDSGAASFYYDDIFQRKPSGSSMYSFGGRSKRALSLFIVPVLAVRDYFLILSESRRLLGGWYTGFVLYYFSKRIAHKCNFAYHLDLIFRENRVEKYYTGNKEDRFALLEMRLCKKYSVTSVCVPHGIEYAFKTPAGLAGDTFYCTTEHARKHLSELYAADDKFIYDEVIAQKMFSRGQAALPIEEIVFFTESRDVGVNLLILDYLVGLEYKIAVKLHPKDSPEHYKKYEGRVTFISDFDYSISSKICLARKSTVLVEAIYNNSIPIAILTDQKDRAYVERMLPSLTDAQITRIYSFDELSCVLAKMKPTALQKYS